MSSESGTMGPRAKLRIETLSDLVFGLALSIGSIVLIAKLPQTPGDLVSGVVLFGFSFLIVIWIWSSYTRTMAVLPAEVPGAFVLNVALLFFVAIEPYLFYVVQESPYLLGFASAVYAVDVAAMMFILAGLIFMAFAEESRRTTRGIAHSHLQRLRRIGVAEVASGAIFGFSALPIVWVPDLFGSFLRFDLWYASFAIFFGLIYIRVRGI